MQLQECRESVPALFEGLGKAGALVSDFDYDKPAGSGDINITFDVQFPLTLGTAAFAALLENQPGVLGFQIHQPF